MSELVDPVPFDYADGVAYFKYNVGTTIMFNSVDVMSPHRITMAMGVWISLPVFPTHRSTGGYSPPVPEPTFRAAP